MKNIKLDTKAIKTQKIFEEKRKNTDILVVVDGNGNEYTTAIEYLKNKTLNRKDRYLQDKWRIAYKEKENFNDFYGFLFPVSKKETKSELRNRIKELEEKLAKVEEKR